MLLLQLKNRYKNLYLCPNYLQCRAPKTQPIFLKFVLNDSISQELQDAVKIFKIQLA